MAAYNLFFKESVRKDLDGIPKRDLRKILSRTNSLAEDPRPPGCEKLTGRDRYRLRQGRYRIVYAAQDEVRSVTVIKVGHRKDIHRRGRTWPAAARYSGIRQDNCRLSRPIWFA